MLLGVNLGKVNKQTGTTYSVQQSDAYGIITLKNAAAIAVTLNSSVNQQWYASIENIGAGTATLTPSSGTINTNPTLTLAAGQGAIVYFDGVNWWALTSINPSGSYLTMNNPAFTGLIKGPHYATNSSTPGIAAGAAAGTSPTISVAGNDSAGIISITPGIGATTGTLATVTFADNYPTGCYVIIQSKGTATYIEAYANGSTTGFTLLTSTVLTPATPYTFTYIASGF
jgi:hypothetical protein